MTSSTRNRQLVLRHRPQGLLAPDDVELVEVPMPELGDGQALARVLYLQMDAAVRGWLQESDGYLPAVQLGEVVRGAGVGRIIATRSTDWAVDDIVSCLTGWQEHAVIEPAIFPTRWPPDTDPLDLLGVHGGVGATAYFSMVEIGQPQPGETVVVSAAAGATGSIAGQVAANLGASVIGIAGSDEKCAWLIDDLGFDACINRRTEDVNARLKELCPKGIDVYYDNVGGELLDIALRRLAMDGRIVLCGAISSYNDERRPPGPANYLNLISRRGRMQGFLTMDYIPRMAEASAVLGRWQAEGKLRFRVDVRDGLDAAPEALNALFTGANTGRSAVRLVDEGTAPGG